MKNLKNVTSFEDFLKEKFSLKAIKDLLIKPLPPKHQDEDIDEDIDTTKEFKIYLFANKQIKDLNIFRIVHVINSEIIERKEFGKIYQNFNMDVIDKNMLNNLKYDIKGKSFTYVQNSKPIMIFNAVTDKNGQKIVYKLLKENNINVDLKNIPIHNTKTDNINGISDSMKALMGEDDI